MGYAVVTMEGRIAGKIERRFSPSDGKLVVSFTIAVNYANGYGKHVVYVLVRKKEDEALAREFKQGDEVRICGSLGQEKGTNGWSRHFVDAAIVEKANHAAA